MKTTQQPLGQRGFTLVELLIAITLLSVGLFALAQMQTIAMKGGTVAHKVTVAMSLAQEAMEDIMSWDPNSQPNLTTSVATPVVYANNVQVAGAGTFNITYTTTTSTPAIGITQIVVTVTDSGTATGSGIHPVVITGFKKVV